MKLLFFSDCFLVVGWWREFKWRGSHLVEFVVVVVGTALAKGAEQVGAAGDHGAQVYDGDHAVATGTKVLFAVGRVSTLKRLKEGVGTEQRHRLRVL